MHSPIATAQELAALDSAMRRDQCRARAIASRVKFYERAIERYAVRRLQSLAELIPHSMLGDLSLDVVFEDRRYSEAVIVALLKRIESDWEFRAQFVDQVGELTIRTWRARAARNLQAVAA
jgi:hypothetical protein